MHPAFTTAVLLQRTSSSDSHRLWLRLSWLWCLLCLERSSQSLFWCFWSYVLYIFLLVLSSEDLGRCLRPSSCHVITAGFATGEVPSAEVMRVRASYVRVSASFSSASVLHHLLAWLVRPRCSRYLVSLPRGCPVEQYSVSLLLRDLSQHADTARQHM